ncbi:eukaryotic aspartyl protease family protein [Striga asiatica]|uniref:Eukaryotic aspartyl protease family protein n=1 Tax=Striga asiatica TaxID=4170 RepID=A0A5A7Q4M7_STRAF|nr:eukaryotic aspartyl protease family protein [Striga asiatica]
MEFNFNTMVKHVDHDKQLNTTELLRLALNRSRKRLHWLQEAATHRSPIDVEALTGYSGEGEYLAYLFIGTPPRPFPAIIDTASDLTWTQCAPCNNCSAQPTPLFNRTTSTSYAALKCPNKKCKLYKSDGCDKRPPDAKCTYNRTYGDGRGTRGELATETLWFEGLRVPRVLFGCGFHSYGDVLSGGAGVLGLGRWNDSIVSQLGVGTFSYCLPTFGANGTGRLLMGSGARVGAGAFTTPLLRHPGVRGGGLYYVRLQWISINGAHINVNSSAFKDGSGGLVIDSGTAITQLEKSTFEAVGKELTCQIGLQPTDGDLELCYKLPRGHADAEGIQFPEIVLGFEGGPLELPSRNYFLTVKDKRMVCFMMAATDSPLSIFGSFQQQDTLVAYDLANEELSFAPYTPCNHY